MKRLNLSSCADGAARFYGIMPIRLKASCLKSIDFVKD